MRFDMEAIIYFLMYLALEALFPSKPEEYKKEQREFENFFMLDKFTDLFK